MWLSPTDVLTRTVWLAIESERIEFRKEIKNSARQNSQTVRSYERRQR